MAGSWSTRYTEQLRVSDTSAYIFLCFIYNKGQQGKLKLMVLNGGSGSR